MQTRRALLAAGLSALAAPAAGAQVGDYAAALSQVYGGPVDPLAAHRRALSVAQAAQARADVLLRRVGLTAGGVGERLRAFVKDPRWLYPDDDAGRNRAVADMNAHLARLHPRLAQAFGALPIAPGAVRRMSAADAAAGKGGYRDAPADDKPGAYYVDLRAIRDRPVWTLPTVAFHEVTPGHLLQMPLQAAACPPPDRVKAAGAYFEAWAVYAEQLAFDLGAYAHDPLSEIGYLQWRLFRLARAVADTGLHALGWTRDRAVAEVTDLQGFAAAFTGIEADVAHIAASPGKVAAEALGALALADWRPRDRALWPAFHKVVLADGPWPFGELQRRIGRS